MYKEWEVGGNTYKLKLPTSVIVDLEAKLNRPLITIYGVNEVEVPPLKTLATVLQAAISTEKQISMSNTYSLIDEYFDEGHNFSDLSLLIVDLFRVSGLIAEDGTENEDEKN